MPAEPARVRHAPLPAMRPAPPELRHAEEEAGDRDEAADRRGPDDDRFPQRAVVPQGGEIEPVRDRPEPRDGAAAARRHHRHLGRPLRDVDLGAGAVGHPQLVGRQELLRDQHPLVRGDDEALVRYRRQRRAGEPPRRLARRVRPEGREPLAGIGEDGDPVEAVRGPAEDRQQRRLRRRLRDPAALGGRGRRQAHPRHIDVSPALEPRCRRQLRHAPRVHHHDAGDEPEHEQHAEGDADVTVRPDQPAPQEDRHGSCRDDWWRVTPQSLDTDMGLPRVIVDESRHPCPNIQP